MRIPLSLVEHPIEAAIAGLLLLGLLFGSADLSQPDLSQTDLSQIGASAPPPAPQAHP